MGVIRLIVGGITLVTNLEGSALRLYLWNSLEAVIESLDEIQSLNKCFDKGTR